MIAKHIPMQRVKKSSFVELVRYITNSQSKEERVGQVTVTNCYSDEAEDAGFEILAKQALNRRSEADKTYHLIISFAPNEDPTSEVLKAIEERICEGLGFKDHQRVSAVHHDTDYLHIHLAINKVHPIRLTNVTPYYDHKILGQLCEKLEIEYGLVRVNHTAKNRGRTSRAADMEHAAGIESLLGWIRRECLEQIKSANTWPEFHKILKDNGLEIQERGQGFVFVDKSGIMVKGSSITREFSKQMLEKKLGPFETSTFENILDAAPKRHYQEQPMQSRMNTVELYAKYREEQKSQYETRAIEWQRMRDRKNRQLEDIKRQYRLKRATIKLMSNSSSKKILYALAYKTVNEEMQMIRQEYAKERQSICNKYTRRAWVDWLQYKTGQGDAEALQSLRARQAPAYVSKNIVTGKTVKNSNSMPNIIPDSVTKKGTIIYRVGASAIRDDGESLKISRGITQEGMVAALQMAMHRYGNSIIVNGSEVFKEKIVSVAVATKLSVVFDDAVIERRRQDLSSKQGIKQEAPNERLQMSAQMRAAASQYIEEREAKRLAGIDILKHIHYNGEVDTMMTFSGLRSINEQTLALLKQGEEIIVLPIDEKTAQKLKKLSMGDSLVIGDGGVIKMKNKQRKF